jgi:hypothetical protein
VLDFRARHTSNAAGQEITMGAIAGVLDPNDGTGWTGGLAFFSKSTNSGQDPSSYGRIYGSASQMDLYLSLGNNVAYFPTKVGVGTYSVPRGGVGTGTFAMHGPSGMAGPHIQATTTQDNYPVFQQLNWYHDDVEIMFDAYYDGTYRSSVNGNSYSIIKQNGILFLGAASTGAAGDAISSWTKALTIRADASVEIHQYLTWVWAGHGLKIALAGAHPEYTANYHTFQLVDGTDTFQTGQGGTFVYGKFHIPEWAPETSTDACTKGQMTWGPEYIYVCVATNTWRRTATSAF